MADYDRIMQALRAADAAGDTAAATRLAQMAREAQAPDESYAKRAVKAIPGAFEGLGRTVGNIAGAVPQGLRAAGELAVGMTPWGDADLKTSLERAESSNPMNYIPASKTGRDAEEMFGKALEVPVEMLGEGASVAAQVGGRMLGANDQQVNQFDAAIRSVTEGVANLALPVPGLKATHAVARKLAGTEGKIRQDLLRELDKQEYKNITDPTTVGGIPGEANQTPWSPTKPGTQMPLDIGTAGTEAGKYYEGGLPPEAYLRRGGVERTVNETGPDTYSQLENNPQPGQGDLFAGTRPYGAQDMRFAAEQQRLEAEQRAREQQILDTKDNPQGEMFDTPQNPYLKGETVVDENGMPIRQDLTDAIARQHPEGQGDVGYGTTPYENPAVARARSLQRSLEEQAGNRSNRNAPDNLADLYPQGYDPASTLAMRSDLTMGDNGFDFQHRRSQAEGIPYEPVSRVEPTRQPQLEGVTERPFEAPPNKLTDFGQAGERRQAQQAEREAAARQEALTRDPTNPGMTRDMFPGAGPDGIIYMANGGFISPEFQKKAIDFVKTAIMGKARNTIAGMTEQAKLMSMDHRKAAEVIASLDPNTVEDFDGIARAYSNVTDQSGMARIARDYKGSGQIINWVNDQFKIIDRKYGAIKEDLLKGTEFVKSIRGFEFRTTSEKSPVKLMQDSIKKDWEGTREMLKEWFNASRDGREPSFKNPEHKLIYDAWQKVFDYTRLQMNALRMEAGLPMIGKQEAYFPLLRQGDWRVVAEDGNGNLAGAWHFPTRVHAMLFRRMLAKESPDLKVGDVGHLKQSKYDYKNSDFTALEAANAALKSQPDILAAVTKAYAEAMGHKGFGGKHAIQSEHVLGAMGLDYSRKGVVDALKAFEMYTERSIDYIAGLEKKKAMADMIKAIGEKPELQGKIENTIQHITDMFDLSRDSLKDELSGATKTLDWVARTSMLGEKGGAAFMRDMSGLVSSWLLSTASFALSQIMQPATGLAGLTIAEGGGIKGFGLAGVDTFKGLHKTFFPDELGREGVSWAAKHGYITPEVADLYGARHVMSGDSKIRELVTHPVKSYLRGFSFISQAIEKQAVRIPYFLMQLEALKGQIKDKNTLFETAAQNTDRYMVDYARQNQAMLWQRMGAIGTGMRPLKQFSSNFLGQFAEFAAEAKRGDVMPMAVMLGTSILLAGLAGNILVQTADDMIRGLNAITGANLPTIHEKVMTSDMNNVAKFGVASSILGYDVSSSVAQNSVKSMFSIPVGEVPIKMSTALGTYLYKDWNGKATEADKMKAYLALTPPALKEYMRNQFVKNGAVPNANKEMELEYQRSPAEIEANDGFFSPQNMISRPSLNEAKARAINRAAAETLRKQALDKKTGANVLADAIIEGKQITPDMFQNYIKEGGDPKNLPTLVKNRILDRTFTEIDQQQMKKGIGGMAAREAIKEETKASKNIHQQSLSDDKSDAKGNVGAALGWNHQDWDNAPNVKEVNTPKIRGADTRKFFHEKPADRIRRHQQLVGAI